MKIKLLTAFCVVVIGACTVNSGRAEESSDAAADVLIVRPLGFAATVFGSVLFVVSLPVAAMTKGGVDKSAHALVVKPADATFKRPMGDFRDLVH